MSVVEPEINAPHVIRHAGQVTLVGLALLWLLSATALVRHSVWERPTAPEAILQSTIDPNTAPWWELAVLPQIGEGIARRIVTHRQFAGAPPVEAGVSCFVAREGRGTDSPETSKTSRGARAVGTAPVFKSAADLASVRGIGPKTLLRIGPHLRFDVHSDRP